MTAVNVKGNMINGMRDLLKRLIKANVVKNVILPVKMPTTGSFAHVLTNDNRLVDKSWPISPIITVQGARIISKLTKKEAPKDPIAAIFKPCELRAMRELIKLKQANAKNLLTISFDCPGTLELQSYVKGDHKAADEHFNSWICDFTLSQTRPICQICQNFTGELADIEVGCVGAPECYYLLGRTQEGERALKALGYEGTTSLDARNKLLNTMTESRKKERTSYFQTFSDFIKRPNGLLSILHECTNCHNCMRVCPICFCRGCFFDSDALKLDSGNYLMRAKRKGGLRLLPDTLMFHLGRMNHMSVSCVSCGACEDACPNNVPISRIFAMVGDRTQAIFQYVPGRHLEEPIPFADYKEEELTQYERPYTEKHQSRLPT